MRTDRVFVYEMPAQIEKMKSIRRFSSEWILLIITLMISLSDFSNCEAASFNFVEFAYKETSKNELTYQEFEQACQQSPECQQAEGVALEHCVRNCISPSCYQDLYKFDELEEGEIDVRLNSFKGCFIQRLNRQRS